MQDFTLKKNDLENALYIVATPIGNLSDITLRALDVLRDVDVVICEDGRVSASLLKRYNIEGKKIVSYNDHSGEKVRKKILEFLILKKSVALVSDAGTPLISDPGYKLISFLRKFNQKIIPLPGASALTTAICASGLASDSFLFVGFLPNSKIQRENFLTGLPRNFTFVFFESSNRISASLNSLFTIVGNRNVCVARELTKLHEEIISDALEVVIKHFTDYASNLRGEFVVVVEKAQKGDHSFTEGDIKREIANSIKLGHSLKDLSKNLSEIYDINKRDIYQMALAEEKARKLELESHKASQKDEK